jgi:thioredoxin reductase
MARDELLKYPAITHRSTRILQIRPGVDGFEYSRADGTSGSASKVLLATGIVDELPGLQGIEMLYGSSVHHCLYCDGFEYLGNPFAAYGKGDKSADLAIMMKHWIGDVVACSDGSEVSGDAARKLSEWGIPLRQEAVTALEGYNGRLLEIKFDRGPPLARDALFFATGSPLITQNDGPRRFPNPVPRDLSVECRV